MSNSPEIPLSLEAMETGLLFMTPTIPLPLSVPNATALSDQLKNIAPDVGVLGSICADWDANTGVLSSLADSAVCHLGTAGFLWDMSIFIPQSLPQE